MATANGVLSIAAKEIGYYAPSDPEPGSKYGRWLAKKWNESWLAGPSTSIWWCCLFVSWCLDRAGQKCDGFPTYNTDLAWSKAKKYGVNKNNAKPGDIVIFDWNMNTLATDHVGFVEKNLGNGYIQTIEGNTSGTDWGSQYAGNGVHRRVRSLNLVRYCIRPPYTGAPSTETTTTPSTSSGSVVKMTGVGGTYEIVSKTLNIREAPSLKGAILKDAKYKRGQKVIIDDVAYVSDGIIWGRYTGASSGKKRYIAIGDLTYVKRV